MAWAFVQSKSNASGAAVTLTNSVVAGNCLIASATSSSGTGTITFTDGVNTWTTDKQVADAGDGDTTAVGSAPNVASGSTTITGHTTVANIIVIEGHEYSGIVTTSPVDVTAGRVTSTNPYTSGNTANTTAANELVFGAAHSGGSAANVLTASSGYSQREHPNNADCTEDKDSGSSGAAQSTSFAGSQNSINTTVICVVYKVAAAALVMWDELRVSVQVRNVIIPIN